MSADETRAPSAAAASAPERKGPRHAAPRKPLFTRFHMPAGKAIALAAMPTAVLMGMGFTPTLAQADEQQPLSNSLTADEYKACVAALEDSEDGASSSPVPSASASDTASPDDEEPATGPSPSASAGGDAAEDSGADSGADPDAGKDTDDDSSSSPDSGSDDKDGAAPADSGSAGDRAEEPEPSPSETERNALEKLGDSLTDLLTPKDKQTDEATASPAPSASAPSASASAGDEADPVEESAGKGAEKAADAVKDAAGEAAGQADEAAEGAEDAAAEAAEATATPEATASPSPGPSESATTGAEDCPVATDAEGGVDNKILLPEDPWFLNAGSLLLKGADYQGIVEVRTASGKIKKVLKYVVSDGTDIGDLHQTVEDKQSGRTHHVQAAEGSTSTIRDGETVMYTESISGKLLGLIPVTFDPENPPPLNIPLIYFTDVTVQQAGQFGGTLHIPGLRQYVT
ncbi:hypothetical protein [Streptomyces sp. NPDC058632]|uniref:hypothetical protein n=1 Tax=Streptomyces sp. NPDC058632 TaxID=3346567 RepID=UPI003658A37C